MAYSLVGGPEAFARGSGWANRRHHGYHDGSSAIEPDGASAAGGDRQQGQSEIAEETRPGDETHGEPVAEEGGEEAEREDTETGQQKGERGGLQVLRPFPPGEGRDQSPPYSQTIPKSTMAARTRP